MEGSAMFMRSRRHWGRPLGLAALALLGAAAASGLAGPAVRELRLPLAGGGSIDIGLVRTNGTWIGAALAQTADPILENVTVDLGPLRYRMPRIELSGASLSQAELSSLLAMGASEPAGPRLARLSAREARIPELAVEQVVNGSRQVTVYRDVVARDIVAGRIASLTSASATLDVTGETLGPAKGTQGRLAIEDLDLPYLTDLYSQTAGPQPTETKAVYGSFSLDDLVMSDPKGVETRIARLSGKDFRARPIAESWGEAIRVIGEAQDLERASPQARSRLFGVLADIFEASDFGQVEAAGIEVRNPKTKDQATGRIARLTFTGAAAGRPAEARAEGLEVMANGGTARVATLAFTGFSFRDTLQGLKALGGKAPRDAEAADLRKLLPTIGTMRLSGLDIAMPGDAADSPEPKATRFGVKDLQVTADKAVNGIPSDLRVAVDNLTFAVPPNPEQDGLKDLAAMGYRDLDLSFVTAASWNEPGNELVLREVSIRGSDMGSAVLRGVLANVGRDVFNPDSAVAMVALVGATARNLDLTVENKGLFERLMAQEGKKQRKSPDDLRREYGIAAAVAIPAMLGNSGSAKTLGQAVARFVAKPGRLTVSARSRDPAGLGVADFAAVADPAALLDKVEITASAE